MKILSSFLLLLAFTGIKAQSLTVAVDGSHRMTPDSIGLIGQEFEIGRVTFYHSIPVQPGKTTVRTFSIPAPALLELGEKEFLAGDRDSIHVSYDRKNKKYLIDGGRYPDNYLLYPTLQATVYPRNLFRPADDNYEEYVRSVDSISDQALSMIRQDRERGSLSPDAADYLMAFVKYRHLAHLMSLPSKTIQALLPATHSRLFPTVTIEDFRQDKYAGMMDYIFCARVYAKSRFPDTEVTSGDRITHTISYAVDSLTGRTRERVLYSLIVPTGYKGNGDKDTLTVLFDRIKSLKLSAFFANAIDRQYKKRMLEQRPLDPALLTQRLLKTPGGKALSLKSILDTSSHEKVFLVFRDGMEVQFSGWIEGETITTEQPKVIALYLASSFHSWQRYCEKKGIGADAYYLDDGLNNPLAAYLLIGNLPTWVALNRSGKIENIDLSLPDMVRNNLTNINK